MRTPQLLGTFALLLSLGASPLAAQHAQTREGFWFGAGMGFGSLGCDGCGGDRTGGASSRPSCPSVATKTCAPATGASMSSGTGRPKKKPSCNGWYKSENGVSLSQGSLAGAAYWYPSLASGFFAKGGVGYARLHADTGFAEDVQMLAGPGQGLSECLGFGAEPDRVCPLQPR